MYGMSEPDVIPYPKNLAFMLLMCCNSMAQLLMNLASHACHTAAAGSLRTVYGGAHQPDVTIHEKLSCRIR